MDCCPKIIKIKRNGLLLYLELTLLFQNTRLYVENTGPKIQHLFLYTANRNQTTHPLLLIFSSICDDISKLHPRHSLPQHFKINSVLPVSLFCNNAFINVYIVLQLLFCTMYSTPLDMLQI